MPAIAASRDLDPDFPVSLTRHDPRNTAASLAVSAGANVKAVQRMPGHASAAMTLDVYADLFDDDFFDDCYRCPETKQKDQGRYIPVFI